MERGIEQPKATGAALRLTRRSLLAGAVAAVAGRPIVARAGAPATACRLGPTAAAAGGTDGAGALRAAGTVGPPEEVGAWGPPFQAVKSVTAIHAVLLHTGKVLLLRDSDHACIWDPATGASRRAPAPTGTRLFCSGHALLADGRVLVAGGTITGKRGGRFLCTFDPVPETWARHPDLRQGRWYPTVTALPDGRAVITTGYTEAAGEVINTDVEVFDGTAAAVVGEQLLDLYAHQFVLPDGRMLVAGRTTTDTWLLDPATWGWTDVPDLVRDRNGGAAVLLPGPPAGSSSVMLIGGRRSSCEAIDPAGDLRWRHRSPMPEARTHMNAVLLPDGSVLVVGGDNNSLGPQVDALLYRPAADAWVRMAGQAMLRRYHSTALLLPDGRVLSAGDTDPATGGGGSWLEIYSPPYLYKGARPTITAAPAELRWQTRFSVSTDLPVARAVLVHPAATTHANDMAQRHVELQVRPIAGGLTVAAPPSAAVAPPGYYMLFVLDAAGVPSVAKFVHVSA